MLGTRIFSLLKPSRTVLQCLGCRSLINDRILKVIAHEQYCELTAGKLRGKENQFWRKLKENDSISQITLEDLRVAVNLASKQQLFMVFNLINRFKAQGRNQNLHPRHFEKIGASLMRHCYLLGALEEAEKMYDQDAMVQSISCPGAWIVYVDMLFETRRYEKVVSTVEKIMKLDRIPLSCLGHFECLYIVALYKIRSHEAFEKAENFWNNYRTEIKAVRRTVLTYAAIQLKKSEAQKALHILNTYDKSVGYYLASNIHMQAHMALQNWEDVLKIYRDLRGPSVLADTWKKILDSGLQRKFYACRKSYIRRTTLDEELGLPVPEDDFDCATLSDDYYFEERSPAQVMVRSLDKKIENVAKCLLDLKRRAEEESKGLSK